MKVTLLYIKEGFNGFLPLGVAYLAAYLRKSGHSVNVIDTSLYSSQEVLNLIDESRSDLYGFSVMTPYYARAVFLSRYVKAKKPHSKVLWGGPHATVLSECVLRDSRAVDYVIEGEGESVLKSLLDSWDSPEDLIGLTFLDEDNQLKTNSGKSFLDDLDSVPFPARDLFPINRYYNFANTNKLHLLFSRGCPFQCTYCQPTLDKIFGKKIRYRTPENVIEEIRFLKSTYGVNRFSFNDDVLTVNKKIFMRFCKLLLANEIKISWKFNTRADTITKEMISLAAKSGTEEISIGVELGNEYIRELIYKKGVTNQQIFNVFSWCKKTKILASAYIMIGAPDENIEMISDTVRLIQKIRPARMQCTKVLPLPGTYLHDLFEMKKLIPPNVDYSKFNYAKVPWAWKTNKLTEEMKNYLHALVEKEFHSCFKKAIKMFLKARTKANLHNCLYFLARKILPFHYVAGFWAKAKGIQ